ncbi:hypothetical protein DID77_04000 [Candidatus Marinamargulisbacteria bacterium SCGC AG-439-L15]|nr:hypothetical protein DID77_04000 [Candidatus Marinamargulisbacteria bacterium SCGC AG-439-L15]
MKRFIFSICCGLLLAALFSCSDSGDEGKALSEVFSKKVTVFGVSIYATSTVGDAYVLHAAKVLAKYLDSDDDGTPNSQAVVDKLVANEVFIIIAKDEDESESVLEELGSNGDRGQELREEEIVTSNGADGRFDASLEEILHLITQRGYSEVFDDLKEEHGSALASAMDTARGGYFTSVPSSYPDGAWYTYDDDTCDYKCMITEYFYWGLTSRLGAQDFSGRLEAIQEEWSLNTASLVQSGDTALHTILTNSDYSLPTVLPDGDYNSTTFTIAAP